MKTLNFTKNGRIHGRIMGASEVQICISRWSRGTLPSGWAFWPAWWPWPPGSPRLPGLKRMDPSAQATNHDHKHNLWINLEFLNRNLSAKAANGKSIWFDLQSQRNSKNSSNPLVSCCSSPSAPDSRRGALRPTSGSTWAAWTTQAVWESPAASDWWLSHNQKVGKSGSSQFWGWRDGNHRPTCR